MMKRPLAAIVLCVLSQASFAQCTAAAPSATDANAHLQAVSDPVRVAGTPQGTPAARPNRELIKTATAGTRDDAPPMARDAATRVKGEQDQPRRGGTAMLLAALALMSGIALRRYGAPRA